MECRLTCYCIFPLWYYMLWLIYWWWGSIVCFTKLEEGSDSTFYWTGLKCGILLCAVKSYNSNEESRWNTRFSVTNLQSFLLVNRIEYVAIISCHATKDFFQPSDNIIFHCNENVLLLHSPLTPVSSSRGNTPTWRWTNQRTDMPTWLPTTTPESCSLLLMVRRPPTSSPPNSWIDSAESQNDCICETGGEQPHCSFTR